MKRLTQSAGSTGPRATDAAAGPAVQRRAADLWWLHPARIVLMGLLPVYLAVMAFDFRRMVPNVYVPSPLYFFGALLILATAVGAMWALSHPRPGPTLAPPRISRAVMLLLLLLCLAAYAVWFGPLLLRPQLLLEILQGQRAEVRDEISTVKGVTTFTQLGLAYVIAYAIKSGAGVQRLSRIEHIGLLLVFVLAVFRAFVWAERLAVIELLVCFTVTRLAYLPITSERRWKLAVAIPAVAPVLLYLIFTASEYFRSWSYYIHQYDSVWAFTLDRLIAYYATAVNNGIGLLTDTTGWPYYSGAYLIESLYLMPGLGPQLDMAFGSPRGVERTWLQVYARPEFNSPTAYFRTVLDVGYFGSMVWYLATGYVIGRAYAGFRRGHVFGLLLYGVFVLYLIESLRYGYLSETRFVPLAVGLVLLAFDMHRQRVVTPIHGVMG